MSLFEQIRLLHPGWRDILEVALVSFAIYRVLLLVHRTRAMQVLFGIIVLAITYGVAYLLHLAMIVYLLTLVFSYGAIALLVVFAPGIARRLGADRQVADVAVLHAHGGERDRRRAGGAVERAEPIRYRRDRRDRARSVARRDVQSGTEMHATVSADLLATIFTPYSPLHDGAVLIRGDTIIGAGCILPLSQAAIIDRSLGTRHRAALGLSEESDALVVVVSEETAAITVAANGHLWREVTPQQVRDLVAGRPLRQISPETGLEVHT
jgi:diadenylate cyclase